MLSVHKSSHGTVTSEEVNDLTNEHFKIKNYTRGYKWWKEKKHLNQRVLLKNCSNTSKQDCESCTYKTQMVILHSPKFVNNEFHY